MIEGTKIVTSATTDPGSPPRPGAAILVVEDEALIREDLVVMLRQANFDVYERVDGSAALEFLAQGGVRIDLLISDVVLPGIHGRELANQALALRPELKVLFITGYAPDVMISQGWVRPGVELMQKPVTEPQVIARVRALLNATKA